MPRIICLSDSHGQLIDYDLTGIDILLHAGDYTFKGKNDYIGQLQYFENEFCPWIRRMADQIEHVYYINGNHETYQEKLNIGINFNDVTAIHCVDMREIHLPYWDISLFGFPYTNRFGGWGFNVDDTPESMGRFCGHIPSGVDIILSHGPPFGIQDTVLEGFSVGSKQLLKRIQEINNPLTIFGHIHSGYGVSQKDNQTFINCAIMDEEYRPINKPVLIDFGK